MWYQFSAHARWNGWRALRGSGFLARGLPRRRPCLLGEVRIHPCAHAHWKPQKRDTQDALRKIPCQGSRAALLVNLASHHAAPAIAQRETLRARTPEANLSAHVRNMGCCCL